MLAALQRLHGLRQSCTGFGPIEKGCVECVCEEFGGSYRYRPQRDAHTLDPCSQEGSGQTHHPVSCYSAAGLRVQPEWKRSRRSGGSIKPNSLCKICEKFYLRTTSLTAKHRSSISAAVRRKSLSGGLSHTLSTSHTLSPSSLVSSTPLSLSGLL